jgi:hypothetical protein
MLNPERAALLGRVGGHTTQSRHDSREITEPARAAFLERFEREVDPDLVLPETERQRRAEHARKAHFARLALRSVEIRRATKEAAGVG